MQRLIPHSFQTPNLHVDVLMTLLTPEEYKVLAWLTRRILGFHKASDSITLTQLTDGITSSNGVLLAGGTGLGRAANRAALQALVRYGIVVCHAPNDPRRNTGAVYALRGDMAALDLVGLRARHAARQATHTARTTAARAVRRTPPASDTIPAVTQPPLAPPTAPPPMLYDGPTKATGKSTETHDDDARMREQAISHDAGPVPSGSAPHTAGVVAAATPPVPSAVSALLVPSGSAPVTADVLAAAAPVPSGASPTPVPSGAPDAVVATFTAATIAVFGYALDGVAAVAPQLIADDWTLADWQHACHVAHAHAPSPSAGPPMFSTWSTTCGGPPRACRRLPTPGAYP